MDQSDLSVSRRDLIKIGTAALAALNVEAASEPVKFGMIGAGSRGITLLNHLVNISAGQCVAVCDVNGAALDEAVEVIKTNPKKYSDYQQLLADKNAEAVFIATPLHLHFPIIRDALQAGKHVFCEASLVFKPEEVHDLRTLAKEHGKQTLQVGLERRYSVYFASVKKMIDDGLLGDVTHIQGQWHQNPGWLMQPGGKDNPKNWRLFREYSGGLTSELAAHHLDTANWFFSAEPQFVTGVGGLDSRKDGRDVLGQHSAHLQLSKGT